MQFPIHQVGLIIAAAHSDWTVRLWDVSTGELTSPFTLRGHTAEIHAVAYSPDGKRIASGSADKTIRNSGIRMRTPIAKASSQSYRIGILLEASRFPQIVGCWLVEVTMAPFKFGMLTRGIASMSLKNTPIPFRQCISQVTELNS